MRLWGKCECCAVLKEEISFLRSLIKPPEPKFDPLPPAHFEADAILSGSNEQTSLSTDDLMRQAEIDAERSRLLSGQY
jgi:hypothetical protein